MQFGFRCSEGGQRFDRALREVVRAEELGFDSAWVAEHHGWEKIWPSSHIALAAFAARTETIRLGTGITILPQTNPVRLAGEANLVDVISGGRFTLGVGVGWREEEMENLGYSFDERGPRMTDHLRAMHALWTDDVASYDGRFVSFEEFEVSPKPVQEPHPPVWIGGEGDTALKRAAYLGDAWFPVWISPIETLEERLARYEDFVQEAGDDPAERELPLFRIVGVDEDPDVAREYLTEMFRDMIAGYRLRGLPVAAEMERGVNEDFEAFADGRLLYGDPEEIVDQIETFERRLGVDHFIFKLYNPGVTHEQMLDRLELIGRDVLPHFES